MYWTLIRIFIFACTYPSYITYSYTMFACIIPAYKHLDWYVEVAYIAYLKSYFDTTIPVTKLNNVVFFCCCV